MKLWQILVIVFLFVHIEIEVQAADGECPKNKVRNWLKGKPYESKYSMYQNEPADPNGPPVEIFTFPPRTPPILNPDTTTATRKPITTVKGVYEPTALQHEITAVELINGFRAKHGSPPLTLRSNSIGGRAFQCAKYYVQLKKIDHSCPDNINPKLGENLFNATAVVILNPDEIAKRAVNMWYDEGSNYDYKNPPSSMPNGQFTQLVWKSSLDFGFAVVQMRGYTVAVGFFSDPGNVDGQFAQNVLEP